MLAWTTAGWPAIGARQLAIALGNDVLQAMLAWWVILPSALLVTIASETDQLIRPTLVVNVVGLVLLLVVLRTLIGVTPSQVGIKFRDLPVAVVWWVAFWLATNGLCAAAALLWGAGLAGAELEPNLPGRVLEQLVGTGLTEEVYYRGFLFPAFYLALARLQTWSPTRRVVVAVIVSQLLFALFHIPRFVADDLSLEIALFFWSQNLAAGALFCAVYITTRNLFAVVGIHALFNLNLVLVQSPLPTPWANFAACSAGLAIYNWRGAILQRLRRFCRARSTQRLE